MAVKKLRCIALSLLLLPFFNSFAQVTSLDFPAAGDTSFYKYFISPDTSIINPLLHASGPGQSWVFSGFNAAEIDTVVYQLPSATPHTGFFQDADIASKISSENNYSSLAGKYNYYKNTAQKISFYGSARQTDNQGGEIPFYNEEGLDYLAFPVTITNSLKDTAVFYAKATGSDVGLPADSLKMHRTVFRSDTVDGNGSLQLNYQTYTDVFRVSIKDSIVDSVWTLTLPGNQWTFFQNSVYIDTIVQWIYSGPGFLLAEYSQRGNTQKRFSYRLNNYPTVKLVFENLPDTVVSSVVLNPFQVKALNVSDNSPATNFQDSIRISSATQGIFLIGPRSVKAINGAAIFNNVHFTGHGPTLLSASSDTVLGVNEPIYVLRDPEKLEFSAIGGPVTARELSPALTLTFKDSTGNTVYAINDTVGIGKLSGPGNITGTLTKTATGGVAAFEDIVFSYPGVYQVLGFYNDSVKTDTLTVTVNPQPGETWAFSHTDTLSEYADRATSFMWVGGLDGYLSGSSRKWYDHIGQHFSFDGKGRITKMIFYFAVWQQVNNAITNDSYKVKIYDPGVSVENPSPFNLGTFRDSLPVTLLGEATLLAADIHPTDYFVRTPTEVIFSTPVEVSGDFIVALEVMNQTADDTIVLWISVPGDGMMERRAVHHAIDYVDPYMAEGWLHDVDFRANYDIDNMMLPVMDIDTMDIITSVAEGLGNAGVVIFPNPSSGNISISSESSISQIVITDLAGNAVCLYTPEKLSNQATINPGNLSSGIYICLVYTNNGLIGKRLSLFR